MEAIVDLVSQKNRAWAASLSPADVAAILDAAALLPNAATPVYSETAATKGIQGEAEFAAMCRDLPAQYKLVNNTKSAKSGDFTLEWTSPETHRVYSYLVEVKNYKTTVPSKEIEKFWRDIECKSSTSGAIFVSLNSKIVGRKSTFQYEEKFINGALMPIAYICSNESAVISEIIKFLSELTELKKTRGITLTSSSKVMRDIRELESALDMFSITQTNLHDIKATMEKQFTRMFTDLVSIQHVFKSHIKNIIGSLMDPAEFQAGEISDALESKSGEPDIMDRLRECPDFATNDALSSMLLHIWTNGQWIVDTVHPDSNAWDLECDDVSAQILFTHECSIIIQKNSRDFREIVRKHSPVGKLSRKGAYSCRLIQPNFSAICAMLGFAT